MTVVAWGTAEPFGPIMAQTLRDELRFTVAIVMRRAAGATVMTIVVVAVVLPRAMFRPKGEDQTRFPHVDGHIRKSEGDEPPVFLMTLAADHDAAICTVIFVAMR